MEMWRNYKTRMFFNIILLFAIFAGPGGLGSREKTDSNIITISNEDGIINFENMSRQDLMRIILSLQKTINEPGIVSIIGSEGTESKKIYRPCPLCPPLPPHPPCPRAVHHFNFGDGSRRSTHTTVLDRRNKKPSKQCEKFKKKCRKNKKWKTCCKNCKDTTCPPPPVCATTPAASTCPPPIICLTTPSASTCPTCPFCPTMTAASTFTTESAVEATTSTLNGCDQNFTLTNGEVKNISSPGFTEGKHYPNNIKCTWTFSAKMNEKVSMTILSINTEIGYDVVRILDGIGEEDDKLPILATMSGDEKREAVISSTEQMTVTFTSDVNVNMTGFLANIAAFKKADLPLFKWIDLYTINIKYPNGLNETIALSLEEDISKIDVATADIDMACIFTGQNLNTSVIITSPSATKECKSLDQEIEIVVMTKHLENYKSLYTMKNGRLEQIQEQTFEDNEIIRMRNISKIKEPKKLIIPIQFAYEKGLEEKFLKYEQDRSYIKKRIREIYHASKYSLKNILNETNVEFILAKNIMFINEYLELNESTLLVIRKYQLREDVPLVVLCAEDYNNNVKGLSFRSGACRKDKERFGAIMLTWRDDGGLAADVLEHELGHIIGGVHTQKNGLETHVGHTDLNSDNINAWFNLAGHRCYGKDCSPPPAKPNGTWICDSDFQSCYLKCERGFSNMSSSTIQCQNGNWSETINEAVCSPTVFLVAGGSGASKDVEMFHPQVQNIICQDKPPALTREWSGHVTFIDEHNIYLCGGYYTPRTCTSYSFIHKTWTTHSLLEDRWSGHSSVVVGDSVFLVGGQDNNWSYGGVVKTQLPMEAIAPTWTPVTNLPYKGTDQCVLKTDVHTILITGGDNNSGYLSSVTSYNVVDGTTHALDTLIKPRKSHGCLMVEEDGQNWIIIAGGYKSFTTLKSTEILKLGDGGNKWISIGDLNEARSGLSMALTVKGPIVVAGYGKKSIEVLQWNSKKWTQFEQSLTTARSNYGSIVELPSHLLNCELDIQTDCPDVPMKENGIWTCDRPGTTCMLTCHPGFASAYTTTTCAGGVWKEINKMECTESVLILAGGEGAERNVEIFHPEMENIECSSAPPSLDQEWYSHTTFSYNGKISLCGERICVIYNHHNTWSQHLLPEDRGSGLSSVVMGNTLYLVGGHTFADRPSQGDYRQVDETVLPIFSDSQQWTTVPNLFEGVYQCSLKIGIHLLAIIGGNTGPRSTSGSRDATMYHVLEKTNASLAQLIQGRGRHGCVLLEENGSSSILVTGGYDNGGLKSTEILDLSGTGNTWESSVDLKVPRYGHGMAVTAKGPLVMGGQSDIGTLLKSIEIFNLATQTWTEYGQSLATARSMYGGIMEVPALLFGCQTRPIAITGCTEQYKYNKEFVGGDVASVGQDETCHSLCENDDNCLGWTWTGEKKCHKITAQSHLQTIRDKTGSISGLKNSCKPKCYLVLSDNDSASTNTQFCTDQNTETDCLNMIHLEPDDFQPADNGSIKICYHHQDKGRSYCEDVDYENVDLVCNPDPGIVTLSTYQRINKYRYYGHNKPYFGYGKK